MAVSSPSQKDGQSPGSTARQDGRLATVGKKRTRTGCLNCRRKRRKCDEAKPSCEGCQARKETCKWGIKVSFRPENAQSMGSEHPSMQQAATCGRNQNFQIINVTKEVIRDYFEEMGTEDLDDRPQPTPPTQQQIPSIDPSLESTTTKKQPNPQIEISSPVLDLSNIDLFLSPQYSDSVFEDGIFLSGSKYQELHATLRSRIIDTARSTVPSRAVSPEPPEQLDQIPVSSSDYDESLRLAQLRAEEEYVLWQNYTEEVAPWLDKFDLQRNFELSLPILAKNHPHLRYSILALSARQMELHREANRSSSPASSSSSPETTDSNSCSLALYQHAIHLLSLDLHHRTSAVLASCIVLCVLEMASCSPKAWRRHLDGCAALIQALGINGASGGLDQALFWVFARMDVCGALISSEKTLIPVAKWLPHEPAESSSFDMYANRAVHLTAQVCDLLFWEQRAPLPPQPQPNYLTKWTSLFHSVQNWHTQRPPHMEPLLTIPNQPFSTLLYPNPPSISSNQLYHTASLLLLKHRPPHTRLPSSNFQSILFHARQIISISISNSHHGCWTNSIQPLWIAGQHMSHTTEHDAILEILERIERETGWATGWRRRDLKEYWGEL